MEDQLDTIQQTNFKIKFIPTIYYIMDLTAEKELSIIISFILTGVDKKMTGLILMICYLPASKQTKTNYF